MRHIVRRQAGEASQLTREQVAEIRDVYARLSVARRQRWNIQRDLDLTPDEFYRYAKGIRGRKFRD